MVSESVLALSPAVLERVVAVADCRNFSRAARHCGCSVSRVSAAVSQCESALGFALWRRGRACGRGGRLMIESETARGAVAIALMRKVLSKYAALADIRAAAGRVGAGRTE